MGVNAMSQGPEVGAYKLETQEIFTETFRELRHFCANRLTYESELKTLYISI